MPNLRKVLLLVLVFLGCVEGMEARTTTTGAVNGVISDQSGAVIAGAKVVLTSLTTGSVQTAKSSASGSYRFDLLEPGGYQISVD